ncbi:MAG: glycosyltransferase family 2 protein [Lachnospiraceae bacterium]|nr:glycosyltransferase family 2 protein [Lachnospiraceae bacterium]
MELDFDDIELIGTVDVIIPTYKPGEKFVKLIDHLHRQTIRPKNIFVINTEEDLYDLDVTDRYDDVKLTHITKAEFDHGGTRNMGASMSNADFLLFMTDDAVPKNSRLIEELLKAFYDEKVAASYARQLGDRKANYLEYYTRCFNYPKESRLKTKDDIDELGIKTFFCSNVCAMYRKSAYDEAGGFVLKAIFNEDMMMAATLIEMGYGIYYAADARVVHWHNYSAIQQFHRNFDVAVSQQMFSGSLTEVKSESEGIRLVKTTLKHLIKRAKIHLIPKFIVQSGFKYMGYKLGSNYKKMPKWLIKKLSLNPSFWDEN